MVQDNMIAFVKIVRSGSNDHCEATSPIPEKGAASGIVAEAILTVDELKRLNDAVSVLADLRRKADGGDEGAMYDANLQIEVVKSIRDGLVANGLKPRFNSEKTEYELV